MGPIFWARIWPFSICYSREIFEIIAKIDFSKKNLAQKLFMWITWDPMNFEAIDLFYRLSYKSQNWWSHFWDIPFCASTLFIKAKITRENWGGKFESLWRKSFYFDAGMVGRLYEVDFEPLVKFELRLRTQSRTFDKKFFFLKKITKIPKIVLLLLGSWEGF
jgi:hypothetical protein